MILKDTITDLILQMDVLCTKKGQDLQVRRNIIKLINSITGEDSLDKIYINSTDNFNIPDVVVLPLFNKEFNLFLIDGNETETCPFGYTVEIHERCFTNYTAEEIVAVILHDILQNMQSSSAKTRFLRAYNAVTSTYPMETLMDIFDDFNNSEVVFMGFIDICMRPFRVPVVEYDYIGCDEVLKNMGLGDAYDHYLDKYYDGMKHWVNDDNFHATPEAIIERETKSDYRTLRTIIRACIDHDIRHYYTMIRNGVPLISLNYLMGKPSTNASLGFVARVRKFKRHYEPETTANTTSSLSESYINPKNEVELRFQVDKIIADMRYAESESEREVILIKIKNLTIKLLKTKIKYEAQYKKDPTNVELKAKIEYLQNFLDELEMLREKTVKMEIKQKRFGLFINYPTAYQEPNYNPYQDNRF